MRQSITQIKASSRRRLRRQRLLSHHNRMPRVRRHYRRPQLDAASLLPRHSDNREDIRPEYLPKPDPVKSVLLSLHHRLYLAMDVVRTAEEYRYSHRSPPLHSLEPLRQVRFRI